MSTLPDVAGQSNQPVPQSASGTASYDPPNWRQVGLAGEIMTHAGRDFQEAANTVAATNERQDTIVAQSAGNSLQQQRITAEFDPNTGFRNVKEGGAVGQKFIDTYGQKFDNAQSLIRDGLQNDNQRKIFDQHAQVQGLQFKAALMQHQAQETEKFNDSTANGSIDLSLRTMAQRPTDELNFQTGMAQINGTLEATAKRKGMSVEQLADLKSKYIDAAYSTRITSIMDGIPGVAAANPYSAEKMFKQVQDQLGAASQIHLAGQVQKAVQSVQARDTAQGFIFGKQPTAPSAIAPAISGPPLRDVVMGMESGGNRFDKSGNLLTSPKGAQGEMQVMPGTATDPGFGVMPAKDNSPAELARVGRDYLGAMTARYNDPALVMAAYNAGPGAVDKWLAKYGDPRTGQVSTQDWVSKIPFAETQKYVTNGLHKLNADAGQPAAPIQAPTANMLKTDLYSRVQAARQTAEQQYPGDTAYADSVASRVENYGRMVIANQQGVEAGARDGLFAGLTGSKPDGSDKPMTIDQLMADPQMKANWDKATPETKLAIQGHFKNGAGDPPRTADTQSTLYRYMGMAANDRESFAKEDLSPLIATMPHADFDRLATLQMGARNKTELAADKAVNLQHALTISLDYALKPIGIGIPTKDTPPNKREAYDQFTGRLTEALDNFKAANGKNPSDQDIVKISKGLTANVTIPGRWFGSNTKTGFSLTPEEEARATVPMTAIEKADAIKTLTARYGFAPTDSMVQQASIIRTLHPGDMNRLRQFDQIMRASAPKSRVAAGAVQ